MITDKKTADFIKKNHNKDVRMLALQAGRYPEIDMCTALEQIEGLQTAKEKLPQWADTEGIHYPARISMEQCSSEATALYKASLTKGDRLTDLTGGFGIDCSYMSKNFAHAVYIERNNSLCEIAKHNFALLGLQHIEVINGNSEELTASLPHSSWIFADPARRNSTGGKVVALDECEPDIVRLEETIMGRCERAMIKCSPMLDITAACRTLNNVAEVHVVAVNNECKELLLILDKRERGEIALHCADIRKDGTLLFSCPMGSGDDAIKYTAEIKNYLYEPNAAIQKAGCHAALTKSYNIEKLHPNSHLYTSDCEVTGFPGRSFIVEDVCSFAKNDTKRMLKGIDKANVTVRNFPATVAELRKRFKIAEGGDIYIFATTLDNGSKVLIKCRKMRAV